MYHPFIKTEPGVYCTHRQPSCHSCGYYAYPQPACCSAAVHTKIHGHDRPPAFSCSHELPLEGCHFGGFMILKEKNGLWKELTPTEMHKEFVPYILREYPNASPKNQKTNGAKARSGRPRKTSKTPPTSEKKTSLKWSSSRVLESATRTCRRITHDGRPCLRRCNDPSVEHFDNSSEDDEREERRGAAIPPPETYKTHFDGCDTPSTTPSPVNLED